MVNDWVIDSDKDKFHLYSGAMCPLVSTDVTPAVKASMVERVSVVTVALHAAFPFCKVFYNTASKGISNIPYSKYIITFS